ncbi:SprT family zinc-dependent metalloprotease [Microvirga sp. W0021]|uniref:SprT family zinc-dependent metalloprotease n=1 Tax=Hohaiivirga grylli TaxID=3133970 RepID=A0ABV0BFB5_9HYPH
MRFALFKNEASDPSHIEVTYGDEVYKVMIKRRPAARRVTLRVSSATGEVAMTLPEKVSILSAKRFAQSHGGWISTRVHRLPEIIAFKPDAIIPLRGIPHRIIRRTTPQMPTGIFESVDNERVIVVSGDAEHTPRRVKELLRREAQRDLEAAVVKYTEELGVKARKVALRDTRSRWGSCSSQGGLSFSWRLIMAPSYVLDYLAAHEVAHLLEMNHSQRFWKIVYQICPHTDEAEKWLKKNGASLHRYG